MKAKLGILLLILLFGCNFKKHTSEKKPDCVDIKFNSKFVEKDSLGIPYYQSDEFSEIAIDANTIKSVKNKYSKKLKLTLIPTVNTHDSTVVDTIYSFSNDRNIIEFYRARQADFVIKFDITDDFFKLGKCISVGTDKVTIIKSFGIVEIIGDTLMIGDLEHNITFTFYFKNNRISRIVNYSYID